MTAQQQHSDAEDNLRASLPTFHRKLSPNELSYFLPGRVNGTNEMFLFSTVHIPPALVTPLRVQIAWAIVRLRHVLMASRVQMSVGRYDDAQFVYTPPASPREALLQASSSVGRYNNVSETKITDEFLNGPPRLSFDALSRLDVFQQKQISEDLTAFTFFFMVHHMINDARGVYKTLDVVLELVAGVVGPGSSRPRTDEELLDELNAEWVKRWEHSMLGLDVFPKSTEDRVLPRPRTKLQRAADRVDYDNLQRRFIGGHSFKRAKNPTRTRLVQIVFDADQTQKIIKKCKSQGVTTGNIMFGLINVAWLRFAARHPRFVDAHPQLPMLLYTAISLREYLQPVSGPDSHVSLALGYHNVVLPTVVPTERSLKAVFWTRSREAQRQMRSYVRSPLLLSRSLVISEERGRRAKAWARIDDTAAGLIPAAPPINNQTTPPSQTNSTPSIALMGVSQAGKISDVYRTHLYPSAKLVDAFGGPRRGPGAGVLLVTDTFFGRFGITCFWDGGAFERGVFEEFLAEVITGMQEFVVEDKGRPVQVIDRCGGSSLRAKL
ncbi:hypothetical protein MIND_00953700 [Mycena indigotica]|uniref:Uncharacterized protein n=1 Tax=Mycena indigotica TaxID=2126181 RepID=A0A8H6SEE2_9AGAR|nr:uncharacterized protein MIND_00953700 [Mycena indigotica]KAF7297206.1 hypothetical protein MIND_00953700 [Mycena indigotica]